MTNTSGKPVKEPRTEKSEKAVSKSPRRRAREFALQGLYQWRIGGNDEAAIEAHLADTEGFNKADREFFVGLLRGVLAQQTELQEQLQAFLDRPFAELSPVESSILLAEHTAQQPDEELAISLVESFHVGKVGFDRRLVVAADAPLIQPL